MISTAELGASFKLNPMTSWRHRRAPPGLSTAAAANDAVDVKLTGQDEEKGGEGEESTTSRHTFSENVPSRRSTRACFRPRTAEAVSRCSSRPRRRSMAALERRQGGHHGGEDTI